MASPTPLPPLNLHTSPKQLHQHLLHLRNNQKQPIQLCDKEIVFRNNTIKKRWKDTSEEYKDFTKTYTQFIREPLNQNLIRAGLFITINESPVGRLATDNYSSHAWTAVVKRNPGIKGTTVVFWDPNGLWRKLNLEPGYTSITTKPQRNLVDELKKAHKVTELWYGGYGKEVGEDCVRLSMDFLKELMERGLPNNLEAAGYTRYI